VAAKRSDEGLVVTIGTSSVASGDTFSFKEKGAYIIPQDHSFP
jgi:hypothetical protein